MVVGEIATLLLTLGAKFFVGFLLGVFGGFFVTKSVYIALGVGVAIGALFFLIIPAGWSIF